MIYPTFDTLEEANDYIGKHMVNVELSRMLIENENKKMR